MKLGTETGSLVNHLMSGDKSTPAVGMGCTILGWSDRYPATVIKVKSAKRIVVQYDHAKRIDPNGMSESQKYEYSPNPEGVTREFVLTKSGWRERGSNGKGNSLLLGVRDKYHDYSF